jgi:hypothetical protein
MAKRKAAPKQGSGTGGTAETATAESVYLGKSIKPEFILLRLANRHGLITGATGTGKTVTLQGLAEGFSDLGACSTPTSKATFLVLPKLAHRNRGLRSVPRRSVSRTNSVVTQ